MAYSVIYLKGIRPKEVRFELIQDATKAFRDMQDKASTVSPMGILDLDKNYAVIGPNVSELCIRKAAYSLGYKGITVSVAKPKVSTEE